MQIANRYEFFGGYTSGRYHQYRPSERSQFSIETYVGVYIRVFNALTGTYVVYRFIAFHNIGCH